MISRENAHNVQHCRIEYDIERSSVPRENSSAINLGKEEQNDEQKDLF
jgi:hypothetical protein